MAWFVLALLRASRRAPQQQLDVHVLPFQRWVTRSERALLIAAPLGPNKSTRVTTPQKRSRIRIAVCVALGFVGAQASRTDAILFRSRCRTAPLSPKASSRRICLVVGRSAGKRINLTKGWRL